MNYQILIMKNISRKSRITASVVFIYFVMHLREIAKGRVSKCPLPVATSFNETLNGHFKKDNMVCCLIVCVVKLKLYL